MAVFWGRLGSVVAALIFSLAISNCDAQVIDIAYLTTVPELELARTGNQDFNESAGLYVPTDTRSYGYGILGYKFWENITNAAGGIEINGTRYTVNVTVFDVPMNSSTWPSAVQNLLSLNTTSGEPYKIFFGPRNTELNYLLSREIEKLPESIVISSSVYIWRAQLVCQGPGRPAPECFTAGTRRFNRTIFTQLSLENEYRAAVDTVARAGGRTMAIVWSASSYEAPRWASRLPSLANSSLALIFNTSARDVRSEQTFTDADRAWLESTVNTLQQLDPDFVIWATPNVTAYFFWQMVQERRWLPKSLYMSGHYTFPADFAYTITESSNEYHQRGANFNDTFFFPQLTPTDTSSRLKIDAAFKATVAKGRLNGVDDNVLDAYSGGNLLAEAIRRSQSITPSILLDTIKTMPPLQMATGLFRFDQDGFNLDNTRMVLQAFYRNATNPSQGVASAIISPDDAKWRNLTYPIPFGCLGPAPAGDFVCDRFLRQWVANGSVVLGSNSTTGVPVTSPIIIKGDLTINPTTVISGNANAQFNVTGCVNLKGGAVELALNSSQAAQTTLVLVVSQSNCLTGSFSSISVTTERACATAQTAPEYSSRSLSVVVSFDQTGCSASASQASFPTWAIAVIAGACALIVIVLVILTIFVPAFRRRLFPFVNAMRESKNRMSIRNTQQE